MFKILVVDDEPIERLMVEKKVNLHFKEELTIYKAENGREALSIYEKEMCDIVLLDIEMPGIDGLEVAKKIREIGNYCVIIFVTAFDDFSYAKKAIGLQAFDYLLKPTEDIEFISVITEAIRNLSNNKIQRVLKKPEVGRVIKDHETLIRTELIKNKISEYIELHYMEDVSLQDAALMMNYSDSYFCKVFKECFDMSFVSYLAQLRINKAKVFLEDINININEISYKIGYRDANYFARVFKRVVNMTPSEYRLNHLGE